MKQGRISIRRVRAKRMERPKKLKIKKVVDGSRRLNPCKKPLLKTIKRKI